MRELVAWLDNGDPEGLALLAVLDPDPLAMKRRVDRRRLAGREFEDRGEGVEVALGGDDIEDAEAGLVGEALEAARTLRSGRGVRQSV